MKNNKLLFAVSAMLMGISANIQAASMQSGPDSPQKPIQTKSSHGHHEAHEAHAPSSETIYSQNASPQTQTMSISAFGAAAPAAACNVNAFATSNSTTLINEIKTQGATCVNELFNAASNIQVTAFSSDNVYSVANHTASLAGSYTGNGSPDMEALYLYIRAGYYVEFYNNGVSFVSWVKPAVKGAIDAFVNNSHFYDNNDNHGKVLQEVITCMDSSEQQDVYLPVVKEWLSRWNQSYATSWNMRSAVNGIFTVLFRGQYNNNFKSMVATDTTLVARLRSFSESTWMVNSEAEYLIANAARELGRLKMYTGASIQSSVDAGLNSVFKSMGYVMYGYGDAVWLGAADTADYYGNCADYGICGYGAQLESQALSQTYTCSSTIKIRSQNMTAAQHSAACSKMGYEENYFHSKLQTGNSPIPGDVNTQLQVNIFDSDTDYGKYGGPIFDINTNNGGMYLEGNPGLAGNVPNFVAYEASYANADHYVWNLEHEYVHYLDGRFDLAGDFNAPTAKVVWWAEGVAEYVANQDNNQRAYDTIHDGTTFGLSTIFATTYDGFDQDRIYRWGYLAVRFMFERHFTEVQAMRNETRAGNWSAYQSRVNSWANNYSNEFNSWLQTVTPGTTNPPGNVAPTASANGPYSGTANGSIAFSSAGSTDSDGTITSYSWNFGDGASSTQANPSHSYASAGNYTATLTVTDDKGATGSATATVTVNASGGNEITNGGSVTGLSANTGQTTAAYFIDVPSGATNLVIAISGGSGDADLYTRQGSAPTSGSYNCRPYAGGNNETCTEANPTAGRWYMNVEAYSTFSGVTLTASYDAGQGSNVAPTAVVNGPYSGDVNASISFSSNGSSDSDGSIASYSWDFGDGATSTSANPAHAYSSAGNFTVTLTVTDDGGLTHSASTSATISSGPQNTPPVAYVNGPYSGDEGVAVAFSSANSYDPDGSVASYSWDFGDGSSSSQANPNHTYAAAGTYNVTLTVTDNSGASVSDTTTASINGGTQPGGIADTCSAQGPQDYISLSSGTPVCVTSGAGDELFFYFYNDGATQATIRTQHGSGNADLYYSNAGWPSTSSYTQSSVIGGNNEMITVSNLPGGWNYIMVNGDHSGVSIQVDLQ